MKTTLQEVRNIVRRLLEALGTKCTKCGYDNPFMDPVENYVCRQCRVHAEKFGDEPSVEDLVKTVPLDLDEKDDICVHCGAQVSSDARTCPDCGENPSDEQVSCPDCGNDITGRGGYCDDCATSSGGPHGGNYDSFSDMKEDHPKAAQEWIRSIANGTDEDNWEFWENPDGSLGGYDNQSPSGDSWIWNTKQNQWLPDTSG